MDRNLNVAAGKKHMWQNFLIKYVGQVTLHTWVRIISFLLN